MSSTPEIARLAPSLGTVHKLGYLSSMAPNSSVDQDELKEIFSHFDKDGNQVIDRSEFNNLLDALGAEMSKEEVKMGLAALDTNNNGTIEFDEFVAWWTDR